MSVLVLASSLACARDDALFRWDSNERFRILGDCGVLFPLPSCVLRPVDDVEFVNLFKDSALDLAHVLLLSSLLQEVHW